MPFPIDPIWVGALGAIGAAIGAWVAGGGAWLRTKYSTWRTRKKDYAAQQQRMFASWDAHTARVDQFMADSLQQRGRTTEQFTTITDTLTEQNKVLATILAMTLGQFETSATASFLCDSSGVNLNVNAAYAETLGVGRDDLLGFRWRSFIPAEQLLPYIARFKSANEDHREFEDDVEMRTNAGALIRFRVHMIPYPRDGRDGPISHWVGTLTKIGMPA